MNTGCRTSVSGVEQGLALEQARGDNHGSQGLGCSGTNTQNRLHSSVKSPWGGQGKMFSDRTVTDWLTGCIRKGRFNLLRFNTFQVLKLVSGTSFAHWSVSSKTQTVLV